MQTTITTRIEAAKLDIISRYQGGENSTSIASRLGVSRTTIIYRLNSWGVIMRSPSESKKRLRCDGEAFAKIDTLIKAQFLGFVYADGCVATTRKSKTFIIALAEIDRAYLEQLKRVVGFTGDLRHRRKERHPYWVMRIYDEVLYDNMVKHGVCERKSLILQPPVLSEDLWRAFILGYFEGDGSVSFDKAGKRAQVSIASTEAMCRWMAKVIITGTGVGVGLECRGSIWVVRIGGTRQVWRFLNWLYTGSTPDLRLDRKYQKYLAVHAYMTTESTRGCPKHEAWLQTRAA